MKRDRDIFEDEDEVLECVICTLPVEESMYTILEDETPIKKLDCTHSENVHIECLKKCLKAECPICRTPHLHKLHPSTPINSDEFYTDMGIPDDVLEVDTNSPQGYVPDPPRIRTRVQTRARTPSRVSHPPEAYVSPWLRNIRIMLRRHTTQSQSSSSEDVIIIE